MTNRAEVQTYRLGDATIRIECQELLQLKRIQKLWQQAFSFGSRTPVSQHEKSVSIEFGAQAELPAQSSSQTLIQSSEHLVIWKTKSGFILHADGSSLVLDPMRSRAAGYLEDSFWQIPLFAQRDFFLMALVILLHGHGLYGLHANGISHEETSYLIAGDSGRGKTTLTFALVQAGWHYVADDVLLLTTTKSGVEAIGLRRGVSLTRESSLFFPDLALSLQDAPALDDNKRLIYLDDRPFASSAPSCRPDILLFPELTPNAKSRVVPLDRRESMLALVRSSAGIMDDPVRASHQLEILGQLVHQTRGYRLLAGSDVYREPESVSHLLAGLRMENHG